MSRVYRSRMALAFVALCGLVLYLVWTSGCNPYGNAYRGLATARATAETARDVMAQVCHAKRVGCLTTHGPGTPGYDTCWADCRAAETAWVRYVRSAINTALAAGLGAIRVAEVAKTKPDMMAILRPVACALSVGLGQWLHLLPPSTAATVRALVDLAGAYACPKEVAP
jgi:hypothetical protein